jgi:hypothetical protein
MYFFMAMTNQRFLYYTPWCITDGAMIASGIGYGGVNPTTKEPIWDYITSIRIREVELGTSPNTMMIVSNSHTQIYCNLSKLAYLFSTGTIKYIFG